MSYEGAQVQGKQAIKAEFEVYFSPNRPFPQLTCAFIVETDMANTASQHHECRFPTGIRWRSHTRYWANARKILSIRR